MSEGKELEEGGGGGGGGGGRNKLKQMGPKSIPKTNLDYTFSFLAASYNRETETVKLDHNLGYCIFNG